VEKIAIIPARGGSKRIPGKNIRDFSGKPIIAYSVEAAIRSELFDEIMVSTDDEEIAAVSRKYGAGIPFMRSHETADDQSGLAEVVAEVLQRYEKTGRTFDIFCCILPTAPFIKVDRLGEGLQILQTKQFDSVITITRFEAPLERGLYFVDQKVDMISPGNYTKRSQDFPPAYHDAGQFYWMKKEALLNQKRFFTQNTGAVILSGAEVQDIDDEEDWTMAEMKYQLIKGRK
jgi:N-acylneuraminate cytidylyltransferase